MRAYRTQLRHGGTFDGQQCIHCLKKIKPSDSVFLYPTADLPAHQSEVSTVNWRDVDQHLAGLVAHGRTDLLFTINRQWEVR